MKPLPASILARLTADHIACHLVELGGATTHRWTDYSGAVVYGGNTFALAGFRLSYTTLDLGGGMGLDIEFDDQAQALLSIALNEGMRDRPVTVWEAWMDETLPTQVLDVVELARGIADGIECDREGDTAIARLSIAPRGSSDYLGPRGVYGPTCRFRYQDARCAAVSAETSCNRSFADCGTRLNTARFGGFRRAPKPGSVVTWGVGATTVGVT